MRLQERRQRARHDPRRAFSRLQVCAAGAVSNRALTSALLHVQQRLTLQSAEAATHPRPLPSPQERWAAARSSLREIKDEQKARLRQYYASAVVGGSRVAAAEGAAAGDESPAVAGVLAEGGALSAAEMERAAAVLGSNGPLRVRRGDC